MENNLRFIFNWFNHIVENLAEKEKSGNRCRFDATISNYSRLICVCVCAVHVLRCTSFCKTDQGRSSITTNICQAPFNKFTYAKRNAYDYIFGIVTDGCANDDARDGQQYTMPRRNRQAIKWNTKWEYTIYMLKLCVLAKVCEAYGLWSSAGPHRYIAYLQRAYKIGQVVCVSVCALLWQDEYILPLSHDGGLGSCPFFRVFYPSVHIRRRTNRLNQQIRKNIFDTLRYSTSASHTMGLFSFHCDGVRQIGASTYRGSSVFFYFCQIRHLFMNVIFNDRNKNENDSWLVHTGQRSLT